MIGNNQPLIVIDGIITNNETINAQGNTSGTATSNRLMDLNNDDFSLCSRLVFKVARRKECQVQQRYKLKGQQTLILIHHI
jgi:hypothetical protein